MASLGTQTFLRYFDWGDCTYSEKSVPKGVTPDAFECDEADLDDGLSLFACANGLDTKEGEHLFQQVGPSSGRFLSGVASVNLAQPIQNKTVRKPKFSLDPKHAFGELHHTIDCPDDDAREVLAGKAKILRPPQAKDILPPRVIDQFKQRVRIAKVREMPLGQAIYALEPLHFCDGCLREQFQAGSNVGQKCRDLVAAGGFERKTAECSYCGRRALVTRVR